MFTVVVLFLLSLVAKGQTTATAALGNFTSIDASNIVIKLEPSDRNEILAENLSNITYRVENGQLRVEGQAALGKKDVVTVRFKSSLTTIKVRDLGQVKSEVVLSGQNIRIIAQDISKVTLMLDYQNVNLQAADASQVKLSGKTKQLQVDAKDAARVDSRALSAENVVVTAQDASNTKVNALNSINASAADVSKVEFIGSPAIKNFKTSDVAKIKAEDGSEVTGDNVIIGDGDLEIAIPEPPAAPDMSDMPVADDVTITLKDGEEDDDEMIVTTKNENGDSSVVRFRLKNMRITIDEDDNAKIKKVYDPNAKRGMKNVWAGFEIGVNGFTEPFMGFNMPTAYKPLEVNYGKSWFFSLNLFESDIHLVRNKLALSTGLGMQWSNYRFNGSTVLTPDTDSLQFTTLASSLKNNRLKTYSLTVPVLIKWAPGSRSDKNDGFHIAAGVLLDYMPGVHLKTESTANGYREKSKVYDDFNTNPFRVTGTVRIGYDYLRLFVNYGLTPYFKRDAGPDFRQFQAGITLIPFS